MNCDEMRELLLPLVYDALEPGEAAAVEEHLASCDACSEAFALAQAQGTLLADAARMDDLGVDLSPPAPLPFLRRRWVRAAAAALLLGAVSAFGYRTVVRSNAVSRHPVLTVTAPNTVAPGGATDLAFQLADVDGNAVQGTFDVGVWNGRSEMVVQKRVTADAEGRAVFALEGKLGGFGEPMHVRVIAAVDGDEVTRTTRTVLVGGQLLARVSTDKPLYKPGDPIRVRALALERLHLTPAGDAAMKVVLKDPRDETVTEVELRAADGVGAWTAYVPRNATGGTYKLVLSHPDSLFATVEQPFQVRSYRAPRMAFETDLDRDSYAAGGRGDLDVAIERIEGGVPEGAKVEATLTVDGTRVSRDHFAVPSSGTIRIPFELPAEIAAGRASVALIVDDGGAVETYVERIPVSLGRVQATFYPESGDLVAGVPSRVYFRVTDPSGEAADLTAEVVDSSGAVVTAAKVDLLGMGRFHLTAKAGETYTLRAADLDIECEPLSAMPEGVALSTLAMNLDPGAPVRAMVTSSFAGDHVVTVACRGTEIGRETVALAAGKQTSIDVPTTFDVGGVLRVTIHDPDGVPRAERLISRSPAQTIDVALRPQFEGYSPGDTVTLDLVSTDAEGMPRSAVVGLTVVDRAVEQLARDEDTAPLPMHFLLGLDVAELEDVRMYTDPARGGLAVDLLLGTQGWRRFAWKDVAAFRAAHPEQSGRVVPVELEETTDTSDVNGSIARAQVRRSVRRAEEAIGGIAVLVGLLGLFVGSIVMTVIGIAHKRTVPGVIGIVVLVGMVGYAVSIPIYLGTKAVSRMAPGADMASPVGSAAATDDGPPEQPPLPLIDPRTNSEARSGRVIEESEEEVPEDDKEGRSWDGSWSGQPVRLVDAPPPTEEPDLESIGYLGTPQPRARRSVRPRPRPALVREFAFEARADHDGHRRDFTEVLYWNPMVVTGADGTASVSFDTSDSITLFQVHADVHTAGGALATATSAFTNRIPFSVEPKLPAELGAGDRLLLPISVANATRGAMGVSVEVEIDSKLAAVEGDETGAFELAAGDRARTLFPVTASQGRGSVDVTVYGSSETGSMDRVTRRMHVAPRGYPMALSTGGTLDGRTETTLLLPAEFEQMEGSLRFYTSALSTLVEGLEGMLREPNGCFEQTSSSNHPNVVVLQYLQQEGIAAPALSGRAKDLVAKGYERLTGFECDGGGFSLYGELPANASLTAYGLAQFNDIAQVHEVDPELIARTRDWLLSKRDGEGGFAQAENRRWGPSQETFDAYTLWALTEADEEVDLTAELATLIARADKSDDPYLLALAANALLNRGHDAAGRMVARLVERQRADGAFQGKLPSIMGSGGANLGVETTSLAVLALLRSHEREHNAERAVQWLATQRRHGGRFGATQATALALRAIVAYAGTSQRRESVQTVTASVNGRHLGSRDVPIRSLTVPSFDDDFLAALVPGVNRIELTVDGEGSIPWAIELRYRANVPNSSPDCAVGIATALDRQEVREGETLTAYVRVANRTDAAVPTPMARVGIPAGLEPVKEHLDRLVEERTISAYELRPREVTLYFLAFTAKEDRRIPIQLLAAVPGTFEGPASHAYLYYTDDSHWWAEPLSVKVLPR